MGLFSKALLSISRGFFGCFYFSISLSQSYSLRHIIQVLFVCFSSYIGLISLIFFACLFVSHNWNVSFVGSGTFSVLFIVISPTSSVVPGTVEAQRKTLIAAVTCSVYRCGEMAVTAARNCGHFASSRAILSSFFQVPDLLAIR